MNIKIFTLTLVVAVFIVLIEHSGGAAINATTTIAAEQQPQSSIMLDLPFKINEDCHQPRETGRCFALFHRYAFNVEKRVCEEFIYGGCGGNKNNFETLVECENICRILADGEVVANITSATANASAEAEAAPTTTTPPGINSESLPSPSPAEGAAAEPTTT